jgi:hypothetical protein
MDRQAAVAFIIDYLRFDFSTKGAEAMLAAGLVFFAFYFGFLHPGADEDEDLLP